MRRRLPIIAAVALAAAAAVAPSAASAAAGISPARGFVPREVVLKFEGQRHSRALRLPAGVGVRAATAALRRSPAVAYAAPNHIATASAARSAPLPESGVANDPGRLNAKPGRPGRWVALQWNLLPWEGTATPELPVSPGGIDVVGAWRNLTAAKRPGAEGVVVAVLDSGVAYRNWRDEFLRSPDFSAGQFVPGYDFVDGDRLPLDQNGHGTHIAGTIAEKTNNNVGLTGIAYGAKLMPVRVLDRHGSGDADDIAQGIRFAVDHGADVINMSFNFACGKKVPGVNEELRRAYNRGVITVASIGNLGAETCISPPSTGPRVIGVGGTTEGACLGAFSLLPGKGVDLLAPGGGPPVPGCRSISSRPIFQVTLKGGDPLLFGEPGGYVGTSMAAAHVSGVAALILAGEVIPRGTPPKRVVSRVAQRLTRTARDLGLRRSLQGAGLIDAGAATDPGS